MKTLLILTGCFAISAAVYAEPKPSVMFGDTLQTIAEPVPETSAKDVKCMQMQQEIRNLKGKPQRRSALDARFKTECRRKQPITGEQSFQDSVQRQ